MRGNGKFRYFPDGKTSHSAVLLIVARPARFVNAIARSTKIFIKFYYILISGGYKIFMGNPL